MILGPVQKHSTQIFQVPFLTVFLGEKNPKTDVHTPNSDGFQVRNLLFDESFFRCHILNLFPKKNNTNTVHKKISKKNPGSMNWMKLQKNL